MTCERTKQRHVACPKPNQTALFVSTEWNEYEGNSVVGTSLATSLAEYRRFAVYYTVLNKLETIEHNVRMAKRAHVRLVSLHPTDQSESSFNPADRFKDLNEQPQQFCNRLRESVPWATHVIGHSPMTARATVWIHDNFYPKSKLVLFYHVIPEELHWMGDKLPCPVPSLDEHLRMARACNVVFSVTTRVYAFYRQKFLVNAGTCSDHRLYIPQSRRELFELDVHPWTPGSTPLSVLVLTTGHLGADWHGVDIAVRAMTKVTKSMAENQVKNDDEDLQREPEPLVRLSIANVCGKFQLPQEQQVSDEEALDTIFSWPPIASTTKMGGQVGRAGLPGVEAALAISAAPPPTTGGETSQPIRLQLPRVNSNLLELRLLKGDEVFYELRQHCLCLIPARAEPFGVQGQHALSAGIPTLIAECSGLAALIKPLTPEPKKFLDDYSTVFNTEILFWMDVHPGTFMPVSKQVLVANSTLKTTESVLGTKLDSDRWYKRILDFLNDPHSAYERAKQLKLQLKKDDNCKNTQDDFLLYCTGGIHLQIQLAEFCYMTCKHVPDENRIRSCIQAFLLDLIKYAWRVKCHPLVFEGDLPDAMTFVKLPPVKDVIKNIIDAIEANGRRIVAVNDEKGLFIINCPTRQALHDLYAECNLLSRAIEATLFEDNDYEILAKHGISSATVRAYIDGSEYTAYNHILLNIDHQKMSMTNAAKLQTTFKFQSYSDAYLL